MSVVRFCRTVPLGAIQATCGVGLPSAVQGSVTLLPSTVVKLAGSTITVGGTKKKNNKIIRQVMNADRHYPITHIGNLQQKL